VQLGLRVAESCSVVARVRAVACRDGGSGRWWVRSLCAEYIETLCRVGDEVGLMLVVGIVWRSWREVISSWLADVGWDLPLLYRF
jgi:hypothetical protein